ncbi:MAG: hypothetical protein FJ304_22075 [Planctomycetes bacterium]|nr:hypothetical protein [Planctomycetota bacterium]
MFNLPAQPKPQTITVEFTSNSSDINVYLIKDYKERDGLDTSPGKAQILDSKQGKAGTVTADVGENTATRVVVRNPNAKTEVTVKVTNKK